MFWNCEIFKNLTGKKIYEIDNEGRTDGIFTKMIDL